MKNYKTLTIGFRAIALIISHIMCIHVAFVYRDMLWGIENAGYSAPANTAFFLSIPYLAGLILLLIIALFFKKKVRQAAK